MKLLVDGRLLTSNRSGVRDVAEGLIGGLSKLRRNGEIELEVAGVERGPGTTEVLPRRGFMHWHLPRLARRCGADAIIVPRQTVPYRSAVRSSALIHDVGFMMHPEEYGPSREIQATTRLAMRRPALLSVSAFTTMELRRVGFEGDIQTLPIEAIHAVEWAPDHEDPYVLTVGVQNNHKNLVRLVQAWDMADTGSARLVICAGPGNDQGATAAAVAGARKQVSLVSGLSDLDYRRLLQACIAYVQPSIYEGLGIPLLDLAAAGAPVGGSRTGNTGFVLNGAPAESKFDPYDVRSMAATLTKLTTSEPFRASMSRWASDAVGMTDWESVARAAVTRVDR